LKKYGEDDNDNISAVSTDSEDLSVFGYSAGVEFYPYFYNSEYIYKFNFYGNKDEETGESVSLACVQFYFEY
jgi:hypothetical protein